MNSKEDSLSDIKRSGSMNLRSKRDSSKHDFACADNPVSGVPAVRQHLNSTNGILASAIKTSRLARPVFTTLLI